LKFLARTFAASTASAASDQYYLDAVHTCLAYPIGRTWKDKRFNVDNVALLIKVENGRGPVCPSSSHATDFFAMAATAAAAAGPRSSPTEATTIYTAGICAIDVKSINLNFYWDRMPQIV
jgi:hypothetical protein